MGTGASTCAKEGNGKDTVAPLPAKYQNALNPLLQRCGTTPLDNMATAGFPIGLQVESGVGLDTDSVSSIQVQLLRGDEILCDRISECCTSSEPVWNAYFMLHLSALSTDIVKISVIEKSRVFACSTAATTSFSVADVLHHIKETESTQFCVSAEWLAQSSSMISFSNKIRGPSPQINLNVLFGDTVGEPRTVTVFLLRHAESVWNEAQAQRDILEMLRQKDHPLNQTGVKQANELSEKISRAKQTSCKLDSSGMDEKAFLCTKAIICSPLTRAMQTAMISLRNHDTIRNNAGKVVLCSPLREKKNLGGMDSIGAATGKYILDRAIHTLHTTSCTENVVELQEENLKSFWLGSDGKVDYNDCRSRWWTVTKDSNENVKNRIRTILERIYFCDQEHCIIVGHSLWFRKLVQLCHVSDALVKDKEQFQTIQKLSTLKIGNAGCIALKLTLSPEFDTSIRKTKSFYGQATGSNTSIYHSISSSFGSKSKDQDHARPGSRGGSNDMVPHRSTGNDSKSATQGSFTCKLSSPQPQDESVDRTTSLHLQGKSLLKRNVVSSKAGTKGCKLELSATIERVNWLFDSGFAVDSPADSGKIVPLDTQTSN